jgi:malate dehydrogenase
MFAFPIVCENGDYKIVEGLEISAFSREMIKKTEAELQGERAAVADHVK